MPPAPQFRVLFVCTGNICRSPLAERLMRYELGRHLGPLAAELIEVGSVGVRALVGEAMDRDARRALTRLGGDATGFAARQLDEQLLAHADLVLVATRKHRATVVRMEPKAASRTFTIREFGRLAENVQPGRLPAAGPGDRLRAAVVEVGRLRGTIVKDEPGADDVRDPYRGGTQDHVEAAETIAAALDPAVKLMTLAASQIASSRQSEAFS